MGSDITRGAHGVLDSVSIKPGHGITWVLPNQSTHFTEVVNPIGRTGTPQAMAAAGDAPPTATPAGSQAPASANPSQQQPVATGVVTRAVAPGPQGLA